MFDVIEGKILVFSVFEIPPSRPSNQHRFRQHQSCVTQLLQFVHSTAKSLDAGIQTDVIYVDMAKAFDKVPHEKLLYKLEMVGVRGQLLAWFRSYLTNRRQNCH